MKIPNRKPDFKFCLTGKYYMDGYQRKDHFVLVYALRDKEIIISGSGKYKDIKDTVRQEIVYSFLNVLLKHIRKNT